jgi:hypothetical protein
MLAAFAEPASQDEQASLLAHGEIHLRPASSIDLVVVAGANLVIIFHDEMNLGPT